MIDYAGNTTATGDYSVIVDTVTPAVVVTEQVAAVEIGDPTPILSGTVSDGHSVASMSAVAHAGTGAAIELTPVVNTSRSTSGTWSLSVDSLDPGEYDLFVFATDDAGNQFISDKFAVEVTVGIPTAVTLVGFSAELNPDNSVTLNWETATEINHAGFNIYRRAAGSRNAWSLVNRELIASRGSQSQGAIYHFVDLTITNGAWEYVLEDVELDGDTFRYMELMKSLQVGTPTTVTMRRKAAQSQTWLFVTFTAMLLGAWTLLERQRKQCQQQVDG